jgi:dephospho-CoA kinase
MPGQAPPKLYLTGRRGAGKSTLARLLADRLEYRIAKLTDPIYDAARRYFGMVEKDRALLQRVGDAFRQVDPDWLVRRVEGIAPPVVVEDVRLPREGAYLMDRGFVGVRIEAPADVRRERLLRRDGRLEPDAVDEHPTERQVEEVPVAAVYLNVGPPEAFLDFLRSLAD